MIKLSQRKKIWSLLIIAGIFPLLFGFAPHKKIGDPFLPGSGKINLLVVLMDFSGAPPKATVDEIERLVFSRGKIPAGSVADYYHEVSGGRVEITGRVLGWFQASRPQAYYAHGSSGHQADAYPQNTGGLVFEAVAYAEKAGADFSEYDNSKSGAVDGLVIIFSGPGGQIGNKPDRLWPWLSYLSMDGARPLVKNGAHIDRYILVDEQNAKGEVNLVPEFCHELGHLFGLPDLYDWSNASFGIGRFSLMSVGVYGKGKPFWPDAWSRSYLGWAEPGELDLPSSYALGPAEQGGEIFKIPSFRPNEYFLLENRQPIGSDAGLFGKGLALYHVDESVLTSDNQVCAGFCPDNHYLVSMVQADGLNHLEKKLNAGDSADFFPGTSKVTEVSDFTGTGPERLLGAHLRLWDAEISGIRLSGISLENDELGFNLGLEEYEAPEKNPPALRLYDFKIVDDNNDNILEPGEQFQFIPVISNQGGKAKDVKLTLISSDLAPENSERTMEGAVKPGQRIEAPAFKRKALLYGDTAREVELNLNIQAKPGKFSKDEKIKVVIGVPEIVLVMDDDGLGLKSYYEKALRDNQRVFHTIEVRDSLPAPELLAKFKVIVWATGVRSPSLDEPRQKIISSLLDSGRKIILISPGLELKADSELGKRLGVKSAKNNFGLKAFKVFTNPEGAIGLTQFYFPAFNPSAIMEPAENAAIIYKSLQDDPVGIIVRNDKTSSAVVTIPIEALYDGLRMAVLRQIFNLLGI